MTNPTIKLQKFLSSAGVASRRKAEELIASGQVRVNNVLATIGQRVDPSHDQIKVANQIITDQGKKLYYLVHKPRGVITTTSDDLNRQTVLSLIPSLAVKLYPVGRLDQDSEGLILLTNDGDLAYRLTHPKFGIKKTYQVQLDREPSQQAITHLKSGVKLSDGWAKPHDLKALDKESGQVWYELSVSEGRNRLVRRMWERVGYEVKRLVRTQLGPFTLDQLAGQTWLKVELPTEWSVKVE